MSANGFKIYEAVCDGIKGLFDALYPIPVQMCQFHMISIVRRYLTTKPDLETTKDLLSLTLRLTKNSKTNFLSELSQWYAQYESVLKEKSVDAYGKKHFMRPRLQSAYLSLIHHAPWLWTFRKFVDQTIPNTNARIECFNSRLKTTLRIHSDITSERRIKLI